MPPKATPEDTEPELPLPPQTPGISQQLKGLNVNDQGSKNTPSKEDFIATSLVKSKKDRILALAESSTAVTRETITSFMQELEGRAPKQQRLVLDRWFSKSSAIFDTILEIIIGVADFCRDLPGLMDEYGGVEGFRDSYPIIGGAISAKDKRVKELGNAITAIKKLEPGLIENCISHHMPRILYNHQGATDVAFVLKRMDLIDAATFLNKFASIRLKAKNRSKVPWVNAADWAQLKSSFKTMCEYASRNLFYSEDDDGPNPNLNEEDRQELRDEARDSGVSKDEVNYSGQKVRPNARRYLPDGTENIYHDFWQIIFNKLSQEYMPDSPAEYDYYWSYYGEGDMDPLIEPFGLKTHPKYYLAIPLTAELGQSEEEASIINSHGGLIDNELRSLGARTPVRLRSASPRDTSGREDEERHTGTSIVGRRETAVNIWAQRIRGSDSTQNYPPPPATMSSTAPKATPAYRQAAKELDNILEDTSYVEEDPDTEDQAREVLKSSCACKDTGSSFLALLKKAYPKANVITDPERVKVINAWYREVNVGRVANDQKLNLNRVCFTHKRSAATVMGVFKRAMSAEMLDRMLALLFLSQSRWDRVQSDPVTSILFVSRYRLNRQDQDMLSYRYRPSSTDAFAPPPVSELINKMKFGPTLDSYRQNGSISVPCFTWLYRDKEIVNIINESFAMYDFHLRRIDGKENLGWLRNMYHSLVQQAVRTDLQYWMFYASIRQEHTLISYPYYTKFAKPGDKTFFRHVDLNLERAQEEGLGAAMVQGSVSFDDEDINNCTIVLRGFHSHVPQYLAWRKAAGIRASTGLIEGWDDAKDWPESVQELFPNVKWMIQVCAPGHARITSPLLPHGSTGPATKNRRTILPWFVMVRDGVMEVPAMGTYEEICKAHRTLTAAPSSPSGHPNRFGGIKWAFPADVHIDFRSYVQKALLGQLTWDDPMVRHEVHQLFTSSEEKVYDFIERQRDHVTAQMKMLWPIIQHLEKEVFKADPSHNIPDRSYFSTQGRNPPRTNEWQVWDADFSQTDAVARLADELGLEPDERYHYRQSDAASVLSPTQPFRVPRSRSGTIESLDIAVPATPTKKPKNLRRSERNKDSTKKQ